MPRHAPFVDKCASPLAFLAHRAAGWSKRTPWPYRPCQTTCCAHAPVTVIGAAQGVGARVREQLQRAKVDCRAITRASHGDLNDSGVIADALRGAEGTIVFTAGSRDAGSFAKEIARYAAAIQACEAEPGITLLVLVARSLILEEIREELDGVQTKWVILRPGPLRESPGQGGESSGWIVTDNLFLNGMTSRENVAQVVTRLVVAGGCACIPYCGKVLSVVDRDGLVGSIPPYTEMHDLSK